ncbi:putative bacteriophage protein [Desulfatibacillum aliphaticivorans]|uniref:Bacteriophage protein n=1 Tax=Desulfatibacillum aliphaticivorans TaxID=218208 RepID=B8FNJ4_DESAL|nr:PD-(D/E)XK nuclease-like domain-containing protein [Desulfatibacillum aliphaticivorans]ACL06275.1 putative bacteriophage protein [Desulfatibacillum aliphaticivorans]
MNELVFNQTHRDYLAVYACSKSLLSRFAITPAHCRVAQETTDAMLFGTALHTCILEPEKFAKYYATYPEGKDGRSSEGRAIKKAMDEAGGHILTRDKWDRLYGMSEAIKSSKTASNLINQSRHEVSLFWEHRHGFMCKARADIWHPTIGIIADLKKVTPGDFQALDRTIVKYKYHWQDEWYTQGARAVTDRMDWNFVFIFVEDQAPFSVRCLTLSPESKMQAHEELADITADYAQCLKTDTWPGYPDRVEMIELPRWAQTV